VWTRDTFIHSIKHGLVERFGTALSDTVSAIEEQKALVDSADEEYLTKFQTTLQSMCDEFFRQIRPPEQ
jgi:hypothetical protein